MGWEEVSSLEEAGELMEAAEKGREGREGGRRGRRRTKQTIDKGQAEGTNPHTRPLRPASQRTGQTPRAPTSRSKQRSVVSRD